MKYVFWLLVAATLTACAKDKDAATVTGPPGKDGTSCSVSSIPNGAKISCTDGTFSTIYNGSAGAVSSCTATPVPGGVNVTCGGNPPVFLANGVDGTDGQDGDDGDDGTDGTNGTNGADAIQPGLLCKVYDSRSLDRDSGLLTIMANAVPKFEKVITRFDIPDSPSSAGFPKFTAAEQALIGLEDYAIDCSGYINVPVTGEYKFKLLSDDGSKLIVDHEEIISMNGLQSPTATTSAKKVFYKGPNAINILYFQGPHTQIALTLEWALAPTSSGITTGIVNSSYLTH